MDKTEHAKFNIFRYQILPTSRVLQLSWINSFTSIDDLVQQKNVLFLNALLEPDTFTYSRADLVHKIEYQDDELIIIRVGVNRKINRSNKDFTKEKIDNWPDLFIIVNNNPEVQKIAIQIKYETFYRTETIIKMLETNINHFLSKYQLKAIFNPLFEKSAFWEIVNKYPMQIIEVCFQMVSPNLSTISKDLKFDLKALKEQTNTQKTTLLIKSDPETSLSLSPDNEFIDSIVNYSSEGGGNAKLKVRGIKRRFNTNDNIVEEEIGDIDFETNDPDMFRMIARKLFK
ncbi:MAG: hypothetical protein ACYC3H_13025 [Bellilinea sp.]